VKKAKVLHIIESRRETAMFPKLIIVIFITGLLVTFDQRSLAVPFFVVALGVVVAIESIRQVPQQMAWVVERLGKFHSVLEPGLNVIVPFLDRVAYRHSLKETPLDVPEQVCITRDNTQLGVDGIISDYPDRLRRIAAARGLPLPAPTPVSP
jgi:regulator of protease activity HflC (stomatin/prohibitin superfamily)